MKIIFLGTPEFAAKNLEKLIIEKYIPNLVITNPDRPSGRGKKQKETPVSLIAKKYKIPVLKPEKIKDIYQEIKDLNPDIMILSAYGQYIPENLINIPKHGILNVHPSLLPKYRGSSPIQYAILNGDKETGVTIMLLNDEMDKGDILSQQKCLIDNQNYQELSLKLSDIGGDLLIKTIPNWISGKIKAIKQKESEAVYTKIIDKYDGKIDWKQSADYIVRQIKAFNPWPGSYTFFDSPKTGKETLFKIHEADILEQTKNGPFGPPGKIYMAPNNNLAIQTGKDFLLVKKIQLEGKNPVTTKDYLSGNIDLIGLILK